VPDEQETQLTIKYEGAASLALSQTRSLLVARGRNDAAKLAQSKQCSEIPLSESRVRALAEQGDPAAQCELSRLLSTEWFAGTARQTVRHRVNDEVIVVEAPGNDEEAYSWLRKSAEQGYAHAQWQLGMTYDFDDDDCDGESSWAIANKDLTEAANWYRRAAEQGHAAAQFYLGRKYECGSGVTKDLEEALRWYRKSADGGNGGGRSSLINALFELGSLYHEGKTVQQNYVEAARCYREAARWGSIGPLWPGEKKTVVEAYFNLGTLYSKGKGVPQDAVEAARLYRIAADEGHAGAQACLVTVI